MGEEGQERKAGKASLKENMYCGNEGEFRIAHKSREAENIFVSVSFFS